MSRIYLEKVELSNFRVYGHNFTLELPPGPGITLVTGPNGMGKTTLFDGIEWCLTGAVSRFRSFVDGRRRQADPLTRIGAPEASHRVSLYFSDGEPIDRGLGLTPDLQRISRVLKEPHWPDISDLGLYLSLTHFLGQSAAQRFSVKSPRDQWEALKGPAGVDRINYIKDKIGGQAARQAFTRAVRRATEVLENAQGDLTAWEDLVAERNRMKRLSASTDAIDAAGVLAASAKLRDELEPVDSKSVSERGNELEAPEVLLESLAALVADSAKRLRARLAQVQELVPVQLELEAVRAEVNSVSLLETESEARRTKVLADLDVRSEELNSALEAMQKAQSLSGEMQRRAQLYARLIEADENVRSGIERLSALDADVATSDIGAKSLHARRSELLAGIAEIDERLRRRHELEADIDRTRSRLGLVQALLQSTKRARDIILNGNPRDDAARLLKMRADAAARLRSAQSMITHIELQLRQLDERAGVIAAAVAAIAAHIAASDTECPVCSSSFNAGELLAIVASERPSAAPNAQALSVTLSQQQLDVVNIQSLMFEIDASLADVDAKVADLDRTEAMITDLRRRLSDAGPLDLEATLYQRTAERLKELETAVSAVEAQLNALPRKDELREGLSAVDAEIQAEAARRSARMRSRSDLTALLETARATLQQQPKLWSESSGFLVDIAKARFETARILAELNTEVSSRLADIEALRQRVESTRVQLAVETASRDKSHHRKTELVQREHDLVRLWIEAGMSGEPEAQALSREHDKLLEDSGKVQRIDERLKRLSNAYRRWLQDEELKSLQRRISQRLATTGADSEEQLGFKLYEAVREAENLLDRTQRTRKLADKLVAGLQSDADQYAEHVLRPLNDTIQRFSQALMTRADGSIVYKAEHHANRSELKATIVRTGVSGDELHHEMNPNLFFSEGQLSALSVSALLAASTSFSWSRWHGLLMDDPLQHNDLIHASAFADLLRQLVSRLEYQIVLSTHDANEAEFILRKCESAGIPFRLCELHPSGEEGLVSEVA